MLPVSIILVATVLFFFAERVLPGRELPEAPGWYARAALLNLAQLGIVMLAGVAWNHWLQLVAFSHLSIDARVLAGPAQLVHRDLCILLVASRTA